MCTLIEVQLKLNLKPELWQRVKYKMSFLFFFFHYYFFLHKLFQKSPSLSNITLWLCLLSNPPSKCNISQRELQYNTGTGEKHHKRRAERMLLISNHPQTIQCLQEQNYNSHPLSLNKNKDRNQKVFFFCFLDYFCNCFYICQSTLSKDIMIINSQLSLSYSFKLSWFNYKSVVFFFSQIVHLLLRALCLLTSNLKYFTLDQTALQLWLTTRDSSHNLNSTSCEILVSRPVILAFINITLKCNTNSSVTLVIKSESN